MNLRLYAGQSVWLVVPDCMLASQAAIARHGPLEFLGEIGQDAIAAPELETIMASLDAESFAAVSRELARRLMRGNLPRRRM